jgi:hypothetical protein
VGWGIFAAVSAGPGLFFVDDFFTGWEYPRWRSEPMTERFEAWKGPLYSISMTMKGTFHEWRYEVGRGLRIIAVFYCQVCELRVFPLQSAFTLAEKGL